MFLHELPENSVLNMQTGAFEAQAPSLLEMARFPPFVPSLPVNIENPKGAEIGFETRFVFGSNFPESQGQPAALQLTEPLGPSELHEPSQGALVPVTFEGNIFQNPQSRSCSPGVPSWALDPKYNLAFQWGLATGENVGFFPGQNVSLPQISGLPPQSGVPPETW